MAAVWAKKFQKIQPEADIQCGKLQSKYEKVISNWKQGLQMRTSILESATSLAHNTGFVKDITQANDCYIKL